MYKKWWNDIGSRYWSLDPSTKPATDDQKQIIYDIVTAIKNGRENIILKLGVGFGKSAIAKTIANMYESSYILTNNIALQKQYLKDWDDIALLMGRARYQCNEWEDNCNHCYMDHIHYTGNIDEKLKYLNKSKYWKGFPKYDSEEAWNNYLENTIKPMRMFKCEHCPYKIAKIEAKNSDCTVCNYHSLYFNSNIINTFGSRDVIVFDEGHYFEEILCQINNGSLNPKSIYEKYGIDIFEHNEGDIIDSPNYWAAIFNNIILKIEDEKKKVMGELHGKQDDRILKQILHEFNQEIKEWEYKRDVVLKGEIAVTLPDDHDKPVLLEPIYSKPFNDELLRLGDIRIFMSGTFPPKMVLCKWFGLDYSKTEFIERYPNFPIENRPIICDYVGKISGKNKDSWKNSKMEDKLLDICYNHELDNGVIHCTRNDHVDYIADILEDEGFSAYKCYDGAYSNQTKTETIHEFINYGGILVGSNIREGLDLKGSLCNFQILFKVPYLAYPKGGRVARRMVDDKRFYNFHTVARIEQAYGRGIRSPADKCPFYVLDKNFENLKLRYFSSYFREAIQ